MEARRAWAVALVVLLVGAGGARADAVLRLASAEPVALDGDLAVHLDGGQGAVHDDAAVGTHRVTGVTGELTLHRWRLLVFTTAGVTHLVPLAEPERERHALDNGTLEVELAGERFALLAAAGPGGRVVVAGPVADRGVPRWLERPEQSSSSARAAPSDARVDWTWEAGWAFVGDWRGEIEGFPRWSAPVVAFEGPLRLHLAGGTLRFADARGAGEARLGGSGETPPPPAEAVPREEVRAWATFEGTVAGAEIRPAGSWGFAAPEARWLLDGAASWTRADGSLQEGGEVRALEDADVAAEGALRVVPARDAAGPLERRDAYVASGEFRALVVDGEPVATGPSAAAVAGLGAALVAVLAAAGWALAALYTRIAPGDVLRHPVRRAIRERATAEPGLPKRELARRVGAGWGAFTFHLRILVRAGYLRLEPRGRYTLVWPAGVPPADAPAIPHPIARKLWETLPADGRALTFEELRAALGVSRQLLAYHLRNLESRGLVRAVGRGATRAVARGRGG